jgi:nucleoside-diphosphate-sugar epimerase
MSVLLTGATGFVGMEVLARLLARGVRVHALVRGEDPETRLREAMDLAGASGDVSVVRGDITAPLEAPDGVDTVIHCAASVSFGLELEEARRINVGGTRHALAAAERAGARYVHVSTAFVSGRHQGVFGEDDLDAGQEFRNTYEQAKAEAEALVRASGASSVVLRPSIIVGESTTGWTSSFNVLYWPLRAFSRGLLDAVPAKADGRVDVVPVDYVADAIVHVACERPDVSGTLNLVAGEDAVRVDELIALTCDRMNRPRPTLIEAHPELAERSAEAGRYLPYFDMEVVFGDERSRAVLEPAGIRPPALADYFEALVSFAETARWGKRPVARVAATA